MLVLVLVPVALASPMAAPAVPKRRRGFAARKDAIAREVCERLHDRRGGARTDRLPGTGMPS